VNLSLTAEVASFNSYLPLRTMAPAQKAVLNPRSKSSRPFQRGKWLQLPSSVRGKGLLTQLRRYVFG